MYYCCFGKSNLKVLVLCLGFMMFGDQIDLEEFGCIVVLVCEYGINFIDMVDVYIKGKFEEIVGKLLVGQCYEWVLVSKLGNVMSSKLNELYYLCSWIVCEIESIFKCFDIDYFDIFYMYCDYQDENLEEVV